MKTTMKTTRVLSILLLLVCAFALVACGTTPTGLWADADYTEDTTLGEGAKTITVKVTAEEKSVTFTVKTDKEMLGDALLEHDLIEGEEGPYGLMMLKVNGILADYDIDQHYWALYIGGDYAMTGVDSTPVNDGGSYELVRSK